MCKNYCYGTFWPSIDNRFQVSTSTLRTVTYNNWQTRSRPVSHTVIQLVTPKIVVSINAIILSYTVQIVWCKFVIFVGWWYTCQVIIILLYFYNCHFNLQGEGRRHFNCSTLGGVEVENQGGSGTALSHWEKRIVEVKDASLFKMHTHIVPKLTEWSHDWCCLLKPCLFPAYICSTWR